MLRKPAVLYAISVIAGAILLELGNLAGKSHTAPNLGQSNLPTLFGIVALGFVGSVSGLVASILLAKHTSKWLVRVLAVLLAVFYGIWVCGNFGLLLLGLIFNAGPSN